MRPIGITFKERPYLLAALMVLSGLMIAWYFFTLVVGNAYLSAISYGNLPADRWDDEHRIMLDDHLLSTVTPKLKQVLINAPDAIVTEPLKQERNVVILSSLEIDQINRMLASTEKGKQLIAEGWDNDYKRGELLCPYPGCFGMLGYDGVAYEVGISSAPFTFPFDPTNTELGWTWTLIQAILFVSAVGSAIVLSYTIQGLRRKQFVSGGVHAAFLVAIVCIAIFVTSMWFFFAARFV